jgi:hypothetical protein
MQSAASKGVVNKQAPLPLTSSCGVQSSAGFAFWGWVLLVLIMARITLLCAWLSTSEPQVDND